MAESVIRALRKRKLVKITLITVGKVKEKYLRDAIAEYSKRLGRYCKLDIVEVADEKTPEHASDGLERQIKAKEGERIAKHIRDDAFVIALAIEGKQLTSEHIEYVLLCMRRATGPIRNIRRYLLTALYNAPMTLESFNQAEVNRQIRRQVVSCVR